MSCSVAASKTFRLAQRLLESIKGSGGRKTPVLRGLAESWGFDLRTFKLAMKVLKQDRLVKFCPSYGGGKFKAP